MTKQPHFQGTPNAPFAALSNEIQAFLSPFQTSIYQRLKKTILSTNRKAFLFPLVESDYDIDFFVSLRVIPSPDSEEPIIQLYTGQRNALCLEDLKLNQLNDLAWQLSKTYLGQAKVLATTTYDGQQTGYSETMHSDVDNAFSFIFEQLEAFEENEMTYPYLRAEWAGINVAVMYGISMHNYHRVNFEIVPALRADDPSFTVVCPYTFSTRDIFETLQGKDFQTPDSILWNLRRQTRN